MKVSMTNADQELVRSEEQMQKAKGRRKNKIKLVNLPKFIVSVKSYREVKVSIVFNIH